MHTIKDAARHSAIHSTSHSTKRSTCHVAFRIPQPSLGEKRLEAAGQ
jgi:hypothetical protein